MTDIQVVEKQYKKNYIMKGYIKYYCEIFTILKKELSNNYIIKGIMRLLL